MGPGGVVSRYRGWGGSRGCGLKVQRVGWVQGVWSQGAEVGSQFCDSPYEKGPYHSRVKLLAEGCSQ